jgi:hypothetical protein
MDHTKKGWSDMDWAVSGNNQVTRITNIGHEKHRLCSGHTAEMKRSRCAGVRGISWGIGRAREVEGTYERNERLRVDVPRNLQRSIWYHRDPTYRVLQERLSAAFQGADERYSVLRQRPSSLFTPLGQISATSLMI